VYPLITPSVGMVYPQGEGGVSGGFTQASACETLMSKSLIPLNNYYKGSKVFMSSYFINYHI
jgi:hypothetical protein